MSCPGGSGHASCQLLPKRRTFPSVHRIARDGSASRGGTPRLDPRAHPGYGVTVAEFATRVPHRRVGRTLATRSGDWLGTPGISCRGILRLRSRHSAERRKTRREAGCWAISPAWCAHDAGIALGGCARRNLVGVFRSGADPSSGDLRRNARYDSHSAPAAIARGGCPCRALGAPWIGRRLRCGCCDRHAYLSCGMGGTGVPQRSISLPGRFPFPSSRWLGQSRAWARATPPQESGRLLTSHSVRYKAGSCSPRADSQ